MSGKARQGCEADSQGGRDEQNSCRAEPKPNQAEQALGGEQEDANKDDCTYIKEQRQVYLFVQRNLY